MNQKIEITKAVMAANKIAITPKTIKQIIPCWWRNHRTKSTGGLRLTDQGFASFTDAGISSYKIVNDNYIFYTNQLIIRLDHLINCPFYIEHEQIHVYDEKIAIQLILFSGNIERFVAAKVKSLART